jgi:PIN domain nuclease of toxin-antitoxin system
LKAEYILDASAVLALLFRETGHQVVEAVLERSAISTVNLSEILSRLRREGDTRQQAEVALAVLGLEVVPFDLPTAQLAADLGARAVTMGLSLADRACLATAANCGLPALTADSAWREAGLGIDIQLIRDTRVEAKTLPALR